MNDEDRRLAIARLRRSVRDIDGHMQRIRDEDRLFQRYGFGSEVHDIQLTALRIERAELVAKLGRLNGSGRVRSARSPGLSSWLLLPAALGAMLYRSIRPRRPARRPTRVAYAD